MTITEANPNTKISATSEALRRELDGAAHDRKQFWRDQAAELAISRDPNWAMADARTWTLDQVKKLSEQHYVTAGFPAEVGGTGNVAQSVADFEMMAFGDLSVTIKSGVQHGLFGGAITNLGTAWHHETFLPKVLTLELPGCYAMTELGHGSDVHGLETTITYLPETEEFEVNSPTPSATKAYIGNAARDGRMAVVFGQLLVDGENQGVHAALVPIRDDDGNDLPGITTGDHGHKGGLLGIDNGTIRFETVRVPRNHLLDRFGGVNEAGVYESPIESKNARFFTMLGTLVRGRICVGGGASSATRKALTIATHYANSRTQFNRPDGEPITLLDYQTHQRKLLPNIARAYAFGFAQNALAAELQTVTDLAGSDPRAARRLESRAAGLKATQTRWANDTLQLCREACGGAGFISDAGITLPRQDCDVFATFEGDNTVLLQLVAKALLLDYRDSWGEMDLRGTAQATARRIGDVVMERTTARSVVDRLISVARNKPEAEQLRARGWHIEMFEYREQHTVEGLASRMRAASKTDNAKQWQAINQCQEHMLRAAEAHVDRLVLDSFVASIEDCQDDYIKSVLVQLCDLYALSILEANRAWFLEHEVFDARRSKAITASIDDLCLELRPKATDLVDGLGVPGAWLNSALVE